MYSFRHITHCFAMITLCYITVSLTPFIKDHVPGIWNWTTPQSISTHLAYISILSLCYIGVIGRMHVAVIDFAGLLFYECFPEPVQLRADLSRLPRISFRIVTKGDYPDLIANNSNLIKSLCSKIGMKNFVIEIVTEKKMEIQDDDHVTQILVPESYKTKHGTLFKARNLQYCLEDEVSPLRDQDWIVHLDEDSNLTTDSLKGIANFVQEGKDKFGQGTISYDPDNITNTFTQLLTARRMTNDYGFMRFFCKALNQIPTLIKGSFIVCNVGVEKDVSFNGKPSESILEFFYFQFKAYIKGYRIGWVEGDVTELGTLTVGAFVKQYSRLFKGFTELGKTDFFTGKCGLFYNMTQFKLTCHFFYLVSLTITIIFDLGYHSRLLFALIGFNVAHNIYLGIFGLYKRYATLSWSKITYYFVVNLAVGAFYQDLIISLCYMSSWFENSISFSVTKKKL